MPSHRSHRLLLINPNTSASTTERLLQVLTPCLPSDWVLDAHTARFGASYIACEASHAVAAHALLERWAEQVSPPRQQPRGVLIGCFGDPGLFALRECSACPVTGLAEASFIEAALHGPFAIVTGGQRWQPMLQRLAQSLGYGEKLLHIETVAPSGAELLANLPLIDSAQAGLNVILKGRAPPALSSENRFHAQWSDVRLSTGV